MPVSLKESQAISELAGVLYDFLPAKPHPYGNPYYSFPSIAQDMGLAPFWPGGSKRPAITHLLSQTLEHKRSQFCSLILNVVRRGTAHRQNKSPVTRDEIERMNELIVKVGFKIRELHDLEFLNSLPSDGKPKDETPKQVDSKALKELEQQLLALNDLAPQPRGYAFEKLLKDLFLVFGLDPRGGFRLTGEQIDGSFQHRGEVYLVEAKWQASKVGNEELSAFKGKVDAGAQWTRGLCISYAGFSDDGLVAFARGRRTNVICIDGLDLHTVLSGRVSLTDVLDQKVRRASETNRAFVPVRDLFPGVV